MTTELIIFCGLAGGLAFLQTISAQSPKGAQTVYQLIDRLTWISGGGIAIAIGIWKPWFTTTWWKALIFGPLLVILMASVTQVVFGSILTIDTTDKTRIVSRLIAVGIFVGLTVLGLRACGK